MLWFGLSLFTQGQASFESLKCRPMHRKAHPFKLWHTDSEKHS